MMMIHKLLRDEKVKLLAFTLVMTLFSVVQVVFWPIVQKMIPTVQQYVPDIIKPLFEGIASQGFSFYLITQQLFKNAGMFGSAMAVLLGASAIARESEMGTLELLLAQPISRRRVLTEKFLFNAGVLATPVIFSTLAVWPAALIINENINIIGWLAAALYFYVMLLAVYAITFVAGVIFDDQMQVVSIGLTVCLVMTMLIVFEETSFLSVYGYMHIESILPILTLSGFPVTEFVGFIVFSGSLYLLALWLFKKKNI